MLATATAYFVTAFFGENFEVRSHEAKAAELGQVNLEGTPQHEAGENSQATVSGTQHPSNNQSATVTPIQETHRDTEINQGNMTRPQEQARQQQETTERANGLPENSIGVAESSAESSKRSIEFPLFLGAGIANVLVGFWMLKDKKNSKVPYIIAIAGSLILIGLYTVSHTVGMPLIGLEHVGVLDLFIAALQVGIISCSGYFLLSRAAKRVMTRAEGSL